MDQFNKALSFILGLVVVAVFIIVASGKFNFKGISLPKTQTTVSTVISPTPIVPKPTSKPWFSFFSKPVATPTPKPATVLVTTQKITSQTDKGISQQQNQQSSDYHSYSGSSVPSSIPNTGVPIVLFPLLGTSLITGIFMKKTGKND